MTSIRKLLKGLLSAALFAVSVPSIANEFPSHAITIVVPVPAGGGLDKVAHLLADTLSGPLKQPVEVANKPGAAGVTAVVKSKPDGYTLLLSTAGETAIQPILNKGKSSIQPDRDLAPVSLVTRVPNVLLVRPDLPVKQVSDLIELAKKSPGKLKYTSSGVGNAQHLNGELFNLLAGVQLVHMPAKGAAEQMADVIAGKADMTFVSYAASKELIKSGKLRPIAVTSARRSSFAPDIPAIAETPSMAEYQLANWFGLFAPAGTPDDIIKKLNDAVASVQKNDDVKEKMRQQGTDVTVTTPEQFRSFIKTQSEQYAKIIGTAKITAE